MPRRRDNSTHKSRFLVSVAVLLAAALSLWAAVQYVDTESDRQRKLPDRFRVAHQYARFVDFRVIVPEDAILGYLNDLPADDAVGSSMFFAAQYVLAPRLLQKTGSYDMVLGNFTRPADFAALGRKHGLRIVRDFGKGVVLFRREQAQP
jgi:hypothetical protein